MNIKGLCRYLSQVGPTAKSSWPPGVKGMPSFPLRLPRTLALGSRPRPGPGGTLCTGAQRLPEIQILGRVMPPSTHAWQACQVCQCSQSPSWPNTTSCSRCREMPMPARLRSLRPRQRPNRPEGARGRWRLTTSRGRCPVCQGPLI